MYATDFEYDGKQLSDFGFIICQFDAPDGVNVVSSGSNITFNTVSQHRGSYWGLAGAKYEECVQATFDICKDPDIFDDMQISNEEYRSLVRWLNRREFLQLRFIDDIDSDTYYEPYYYDASFNIDKIKLHEVLYGLRLTMQTNRPFAYGETISATFDATGDIEMNKFFAYNIEDKSDEIGYIYAKITITVTKAGNISILNNACDNAVVINNCELGEVITIDYPTIKTTSSTHDITNDFNYCFPKIVNRYNNNQNIFSISGYCTVDIEYKPVVKAGV